MEASTEEAAEDRRASEDYTEGCPQRRRSERHLDFGLGTKSFYQVFVPLGVSGSGVGAPT